jgi:hypothetical protein
VRTAQRACGAVDVCRTRFATALVDVSLESGPTIPAASSDSPVGAAIADGLQPMDVDSADGGEAQGDAAAVVSEELLTLYTQRLYEPATSTFGQASVCEGGSRSLGGLAFTYYLWLFTHADGAADTTLRMREQERVCDGQAYV